MDAHDRLAYYKSLLADNITLTPTQNSDMLLIIRERGGASAGAMPRSGAKYAEAKRKL